ncbi:MAG TPA: VCBS repeat-containing protein, partial [Cyclobacteriaceae bacterium]|nr:VCBS repeat-containing protein [Cyclobacteriaceae bacterium]
MLAVFLILYSSCETPEHKEERIARMYCGYCHAFPDPSLLDRTTWDKSVLPLMEFHMGNVSMNMIARIHPEDIDNVLSSLPSRPMANAEDWQLIRDYYLKNSPDSVYTEHPEIMDTLTLFEAAPLKNTFEPYVTFLRYDSGNHLLYAGTRLMDLFTFNEDGQRVDSLKLGSPPSWVIKQDSELVVTAMGIMDPNDRPAGSVIRINADKKLVTVIDSIKRPVYFEQHDLNGDGREDMIVSAFGNYTGNISVYEAASGDWITHTLSATPGARKTVVRDFNADGKPDILALFAQGNERIVLYTNRGDFEFDETLLLQFSPVDGTSYFEVVDFNNDG